MLNLKPVDMELLQIKHSPEIVQQDITLSSSDQFIQANTQPIDFESLKSKCIIPSFAKDNESTISHTDFIYAVQLAVENWFKNETILKPAIRVSHPIKGRIPEAMGKPAKFLLEEEKTLYYERMAFIIEIPTISTPLKSNDLNLCVGGVRGYNLENLYNKKTEEKFKVFIGFQNMVCCNLCISTDGFMGELKVRTVAELVEEAFKLFSSYNAHAEIKHFSTMNDYSLTEKQFAQLLGRSRMFHFLPSKEKKELPQFPLIDSQLSTVTKNYFSDESFCRNDTGDIDLWRLYNLLSGANKSSYITTFLDRNVGSLTFIRSLQNALNEGSEHWFLS